MKGKHDVVHVGGNVPRRNTHWYEIIVSTHTHGTHTALVEASSEAAALIRYGNKFGAAEELMDVRISRGDGVVE